MVRREAREVQKSDIAVYDYDEFDLEDWTAWRARVDKRLDDLAHQSVRTTYSSGMHEFLSALKTDLQKLSEQKQVQREKPKEQQLEEEIKKLFTSKTKAIQGVVVCEDPAPLRNKPSTGGTRLRDIRKGASVDLVRPVMRTAQGVWAKCRLDKHTVWWLQLYDAIHQREYVRVVT